MMRMTVPAPIPRFGGGPCHGCCGGPYPCGGCCMFSFTLPLGAVASRDALGVMEPIGRFGWVSSSAIERAVRTRQVASQYLAACDVSRRRCRTDRAGQPLTQEGDQGGGGHRRRLGSRSLRPCHRLSRKGTSAPSPCDVPLPVPPDPALGIPRAVVAGEHGIEEAANDRHELVDARPPSRSLGDRARGARAVRVLPEVGEKSTWICGGSFAFGRRNARGLRRTIVPG